MVAARPSHRLGQLLLLLSLGAGGCVEYDFKNGTGYTTDVATIKVDPQEINFGILDVGEEKADVVTITNIGTATLEISGLTLDGADSFTVSSDHMLDSLEPEEETEFRVTYVASGEVDEATVTVASSDTESPEVPVTLLGGLTGPVLEWSPDPLDFGYVSVGEDATEDLTLTNTGGTDLIISDLTLDGDEFSVEMPSFPLTLATGEETTLEVTYTPSETGDATGTLTATSNADEDNDVELLGTSSSGPIAVCSVDPETVTTHSETANWIGDESYDPSGAEIVEYEWTLISQPEASTATMPSGEAIRRNFEWDLAGEYVGQLVVTNERGEVSDPCTATLEAIPSDDLWIEMFWAHSGDDMDLHLLAPGGSFNSLTSDCYFSNCTGTSGLDWGTRGDTSDNPSLDIDDIPGTGPENIRLETPEAGTFTVYVHDYPSTVYSGSNAVTVTIYIGGTVAWTDTRTISGEDSREEFAQISFPDGTVTSR